MEKYLVVDMNAVNSRPIQQLPRTPFWVVLVLAIVVFAWPVCAFPPAPHHQIYGLVRDEWGNPLNMTNAEVFLETTAGARTKTALVPNLRPGVNYELAVPMDSGIRSDLYKPTALRPEVAFKMKVKIGQTAYLPIQMTGNYAQLGQPGQSTRVDLTLGEDSDGDGLPDAWERALIALAGDNLTLNDINPGDDFDQDGINNFDEYTAGTYAFDDQNGFDLKITTVRERAAVLRFTAVRGRSYSILGSDDLRYWVPIPFRLPADGAADFMRQNYQAKDVLPVEVEVPLTSETQAIRVFKLMVQ